MNPALNVRKKLIINKIELEIVYEMCRNVEKVMEMYSKELLEMDRNTVQYMIDEMQEEINQKDEELSQKDAQLKQINAQLEQERRQYQETLEKMQRQLQELQEK